MQWRYNLFIDDGEIYLEKLWDIYEIASKQSTRTAIFGLYIT